MEERGLGWGILVMFFGCEEAGVEGVVDPLELSLEGETGALSSRTLYSLPGGLESQSCTLLQRAVFLGKRGRDFEFHRNF